MGLCSTSGQLSLVSVQIGIFKDTKKNFLSKKLFSNILLKSANVNVKEEEDSKNTEAADMVACSNKSPEIHYYIDKKQLSATSRPTKLHQ